MRQHSHYAAVYNGIRNHIKPAKRIGIRIAQHDKCINNSVIKENITHLQDKGVNYLNFFNSINKITNEIKASITFPVQYVNKIYKYMYIYKYADV